MNLLARLGWKTMPLSDAAACLRERRAFPARRFALTFDDGDADLLWFALPILTAHGFQATVFAVSDYLGRRNDWERASDLRGRPLLDAAGLDLLARSGWEIGAHSASHPNLTRLDPAELQREVAGCRASLEAQLQRPVPCFCYPSGAFDPSVVDAVRHAGYEIAVTTRRGCVKPGDDLLRLPRVSVSHRASPAGLLWRILTARRRPVSAPL
jgi:peptidoglycan/xylan/chitin deacetylase (PgdA/CDA1 family)